MKLADTKTALLRRLLADEVVPDGWSIDIPARQALTSEWRLAQHIASGDKPTRRKYAGNHEDAAESERRVRLDHAGRYPIELLQNAQDACADAGTRGKAWLRVTDTALVVANQGVPFNAERIRSLVRLGGTTKRPGDPKHHTIGYKGIGFTSVLEISDKPQIISTGVAFGLDRELAKRELQNILGITISRVPARYFPFPLSPMEWRDDASLVNELFSAGATTIVRLPFRAGVGPAGARRDIERVVTPTTLLLMPALDSLDIGERRCWTRRRGRQVAGGQLHHLRSEEGENESWLVKETRVPVKAAAIEALGEDVWSNVKDLHVLVAFPWSKGRPRAGESVQKLHAYFPTDDSLGRSLLAHGDFFLESNRRRVHTAGASKAISDTVADGIVQLVADLGTEFCKELPDKIPDLLACLVPQHAPQGYGEELASLLDQTLATRPVLRTAKGKRVAPARGMTLGVEIPAQEARDLVRMLNGIERLLTPEYEGVAGQWLRSLGADEISAETVAHHLKPGRAPSYERAVLAVAAWWRAKPRWTERAARAQLRILKSIEGKWCTAGQLCEPVAGVPALPQGLERATYVPPRNSRAAKFISEELDVEQMDLARALDVVLEALEDGDYGRDDRECKAAHEFVRNVYRREKALVRDHPNRTLVPVAVRSWRRGASKKWRGAGETYFSRDWTGNTDLEQLYRRFSEQEFLAVDPPDGASKRNAEFRFFRTIGVATEPRRVEKQGAMWEAPASWRTLPDVQAAQACPDGHPQSTRFFKALVIDRLESLLGELDLNEARALVKILARNSEPYGSDAKIWCSHSAHRGRGSVKTTGLQRWLLETNPWVPVQGDPLGHSLAPPGEAWVDVNGRALRACLPEAAVSRSIAAKLKLPSAAKPNPEALVDALFTLQEAHPTLADAAPEVIEGSFLLLQRLQAVLSKRSDETVVWPPFPSYRAGEPVWAKNPAIPDVSLPTELPLEILKEGNWDELHRVFALPYASTVVTITTETEGAKPAELAGLRPGDRARLAALLTVNGADLKLTARRLGRLRVMRCDGIRTTFSLNGYRGTKPRKVYLESGEDSGSLFVVEPFREDGLSELSAEVTKYLDARSQRQNIHLYLALGEQILVPLGVGPAAIEEAEEALHRYVRVAEPAPAVRQAKVREEPEEHEEEGEDCAQPEVPADQAEAEGGERSRRAAKPTIRTVFRGGGSTIAPIESDEGLRSLPEIDFIEDRSEPYPPRGDRPSGARGGTGRSGSPSVSSETRRNVERRAVDIATRYAHEKLGCAEVRDVQESNKGWDLEFVFDGAWWPVEIKGFAGGVSAFILTRNEIAAAKSNKLYRILLVTGVSGGKGKILEVENPASWITNDDLDAMSWAIYGWNDHSTVASAWFAP